MSQKTIGFIETTNTSKNEKVKQMYDKTIKYVLLDPEIAVLQAYKTLKFISEDLHIKHNLFPQPETFSLDQLINHLIEEKVLPKAIALNLVTFQILLQDIEEEDKASQEPYLKQAFDSFETIVLWYLGERSANLSILSKGINHLSQNDNLLNNPEQRYSTGSTAQFASLTDMTGLVGDDGLIIGQQLRLSEQKSYEHCVCVGPTGSGKTASFFIPNVLSLPTASIVVTDPKGEIFQKTAATNIAQGKKIIVFCPLKKHTMKYNPLALCKTESEVRELAQILLTNGAASISALTQSQNASGDHNDWINMSVPLLTAFLIYVKDLKPPRNTISYALTLITENDIDTLKLIMSDAHILAEKQFNIFMQSAESEKTAASIRTVLASNLQIFTDPIIENTTSLNEIAPLMLREQPTVLYVMVPEHKSAMMAPLMATFYSQLMNDLMEPTDSQVPVYFLLDEFANIGVIPNIDSALATFRSRKIGIGIGIQSLNQLQSKYRHSWHTILDNLKTKFVFPGLSNESADYFSKMCGEKEVKKISKVIGKESTVQLNSHMRPLLTPDEIRRLEDETLIAIIDNKSPFRDKQMRFYKEQALLSLTEDEIELDEFLTDHVL